MRLAKIKEHPVYTALAVLWFLLVVLWPKPSNQTGEAESAEGKLTGEGLYKAKITNANFGLLGVQFYESNDDIRRWHILSNFAELHRKENYAFLKDVTANFFAIKTGNMVVTKSDYGRSWTDKNLVELEGNISIKSKKGYYFTMDKLNYDSKTHEFSTDDSVSMKGPNREAPSMFLKGNGLAADIDEEHFILHRNVTGNKRLKKNEWMKIHSNSGEFFTNEGRAIFLSNVRAFLPTATITSEIFEIAGDDGKESIEARGNVTLKNRDRVGRAENAYIEVGGNKITLEGKAQVEAKNSKTFGRRIVMYTDDDRIEVTEAKGETTK